MWLQQPAWVRRGSMGWGVGLRTAPPRQLLRLPLAMQSLAYLWAAIDAGDDNGSARCCAGHRHSSRHAWHSRLLQRHRTGRSRASGARRRRPSDVAWWQARSGCTCHACTGRRRSAWKALGRRLQQLRRNGHAWSHVLNGGQLLRRQLHGWPPGDGAGRQHWLLWTNGNASTRPGLHTRGLRLAARASCSRTAGIGSWLMSGVWQQRQIAPSPPTPRCRPAPACWLLRADWVARTGARDHRRTCQGSSGLCGPRHACNGAEAKQAKRWTTIFRKELPHLLWSIQLAHQRAR